MPTRIADQTLAYYFRHNPDRDNVGHIEQGKSDGSGDRPASDATEFGPYEHEIVNKGRSGVQSYNTEFDSEQQAKESALETKETALANTRANERSQITIAQSTETTQLNQECGAGSPEYTRLKSDENSAQVLLNKVRLEVGDRPLQAKSPLLYLVMLGVLAVVEIPINQQAFAFFFDHIPAFAYLLAFGIGLFFIYMAHVNGLSLRQSGNDPGQKDPSKHYWVIAATTVFVLIVMFFLAMIRYKFIEFIETEGNIDAVLEQIGLIEVVSEGASDWLKVITNDSSIAFFLMNVAVFVVGGFVSYHRHDPHPDYEKVLNDKNKVQRHLKDLEEKHNEGSLAIKRKYEQQLEGLEVRLAQEQQSVDDLRSEIQQAATTRDNELKTVKNVLFSELNAYQDSNSSSRTTPAPSYFGSQTRQMIAEALTT